MNRRKAVAVLSFTPFVPAHAKDSSVPKKFVGVWKLVSSESKKPPARLDILSVAIPSAGSRMTKPDACRPC
jgi:hypothetical protein